MPLVELCKITPARKKKKSHHTITKLNFIHIHTYTHTHDHTTTHIHTHTPIFIYILSYSLDEYVFVPHRFCVNVV